MADIIIDKPKANLLCTAITLGFLDKEMNDRPGKKLVLLIESGEETQYKTLFDQIVSLKVDFRNKLKTDATAAVETDWVKIAPKGSVKAIPFVIAQTDKVGSDSSQQVEDENAHMALRTNLKCNQRVDVKAMRGAYIGGRINVSDVQLLGPSEVYTYINQAGVRVEHEASASPKDYYTQFLAASHAACDFLANKPTITGLKTDPQALNNERQSLKSKQREVNQLNWGGGTQERNLASVHGLIRAIFAFNADQKGIGSDSLAVCCELALGKMTTKVASCIPCSLFAFSNGTPPNFTHLGRGDFWNFPENLAHGNAKYLDWHRYVNECFLRGIKLLQLPESENPFLGRNDIPELFLYALTIPDSFVTRMKAYWNL